MNTVQKPVSNASIGGAFLVKSLRDQTYHLRIALSELKGTEDEVIAAKEHLRIKTAWNSTKLIEVKEKQRRIAGIAADAIKLGATEEEVREEWSEYNGHTVAEWLKVE